MYQRSFYASYKPSIKIVITTKLSTTLTFPDVIYLELFIAPGSVASLTIKSRCANISVFIDCENN